MKLLCSLFFLFISFLSSSQIKISSVFIELNDGVNLAADIYVHEDYKGQKLPTLVQFERYQRGSVERKSDFEFPLAPLYPQNNLFLNNGYVLMIVDTRGSGASFGTRIAEYTPRQVMDAKTVLDWIVAQEWSNGNIGSFGTSYSGTTAELLCATKHPAIKAVIPGWSDFDLYRSPVRPYGLFASKLMRKWGTYVRLCDQDRSLILGSKLYPVDKDSIKPALKEHKGNMKVYKVTKEKEFRDSRVGDYSYEECSVVHWQKEIEESGVPMLIFSSWFDSGVAEGTIQRLEHFNVNQKVIILASGHGGYNHASPFEVSDSILPAVPPYEDQIELQLEFFDFYLKEKDNGVDQWPMLQYYNVGEEVMKTSDVWPVNGTVLKPFYFDTNNVLSTEISQYNTGVDTYKVDYRVGTSAENRWMAQLNGAVMNLDTRNEMDERMLTYTSEPLNSDLQITGTPTVSLNMSSTHTDGAVLVYLEVVDESGNSVYITEGGLRLIHRKELKDSTQTFNLHSFNEADAMPMEPGNYETITIRLLPTSVLVKKGQRIRVAIAGADNEIFDRVPKRGTPTYSIKHNNVNASFIILPIVEPQ